MQRQICIHKIRKQHTHAKPCLRGYASRSLKNRALKVACLIRCKTKYLAIHGISNVVGPNHCCDLVVCAEVEPNYIYKDSVIFPQPNYLFALCRLS